VVFRLNKGLANTGTALVATTLLTFREGLSMNDLVSKVNWLREEIVNRGGLIAHEGETQDLVNYGLKLLDNLVETQRGIFVPKTSNGDFRSLLILSYYRNELLHHFIGEGILSVAIATVSALNDADLKIDIKKVIAEAEYLSDLLSLEFVNNPSPRTKFNFHAVIEYLVQRDFLVYAGKDKEFICISDLGQGPISFYSHIFWPLIDSYWISALCLLSLSPSTPFDRKNLLTRIQFMCEKLHSQNKLYFFESCSMEVLVNCLEKFHKLKVIRVQENANPPEKKKRS